MECPYLKKIMFEKIDQLVIQDIDDDDIQTNNIHHIELQEQLKKNKENPSVNIQRQDLKIVLQYQPDQSKKDQFQKYTSLCLDDQQIPCQHIQPIYITAPNVHSIFDYQLKSIDDIKLTQIKFPKSLIINKISIEEDQCDIPNQIQNGSKISNPHVLDSKMGKMNLKILQFYGQVMLNSHNDKENTYQCSLSKNILMITRQKKTKYFIQLKKTQCKIKEQINNGIQVLVKLKSTQQCIKIYFFSKSQKQTFKKVLQQMLEELQFDQSQLEEFKTQVNTSYSELDSLGFEVQRISLQEVVKIGDTFDIILFKNKNLISKFQRFFTNSDYDHTAMLLKTTDGDLLMLQCTSNMGVAVYNFQSLLKISKDKYFHRLGIRRYMGQRNMKQMSILQKFIRQSIGKPYKFDPMYLISNSNSNSNGKQKKQNQTFFCSQLVAQSLQRAKIMTDKIPSFKYLPKHLSSDNLNDYMIDGYFSQIIIIK